MNPFPIDAYAYANRLRWAHPAEKLLFAAITLCICLVSRSPLVCLLALALTTPMVDLTEQLRRWRVPVLFVELMTLIYRFIFVLLETAQAMRLAQEARLGYATWRGWLRSVGMLASNLYLRANTRASALFTALSARGYTGDLRVLQATPRWSPGRLALIGAADGVLLAVALAVRFSPLSLVPGLSGVPVAALAVVGSLPGVAAMSVFVATVLHSLGGLG